MSVTLGTKWAAIAAENDALKIKVADLSEKLEKMEKAKEYNLSAISEFVAASAVAEARGANLGFENLEISSQLSSLTRENTSLKIQLDAERNRSVDLEISLEAKNGMFSRLEEKFQGQKKISEKLATGLSARDNDLKFSREISASKNSENDRLLRDLED